MTPPNDAARPVYIVNTGETDEVGREIYHVNRNGPFPLADNEKLYTAADYDALWAERDELRRLANELEQSSNHRNMEAIQERARAEAAEAKVEDFIEAAEHYFSSGTAAALRAVLDAALNEGGE